MGGGSALYIRDGATDRRWFGTTPEIHVNLLGAKAARAIAGFIIAVEEGLELNLLGLNFGIDPGDLALKLPGIGRIGF